MHRERILNHRIFAWIGAAILCAVPASLLPQSPHPGMGAIPIAGGGVSFRVWAPNANSVHLRGAFNSWALTTPMVSEGANGMWSVVVPSARAGQEYKFFVTNNNPSGTNPTTAWRRDPYSRRLAHLAGGDANSVIYDPAAYAWKTPANFTAPALKDLVIYEMHIGSWNAPTGTPGTFAQAIARLDHVVALGVNAVELMPLHESPGTNGWGYDAQLVQAIRTDFGGPDAFKGFVDACHARGLAVLMDVVYNHASNTANDMWEFDLTTTGDAGGIWFFNDAANRTSPWGPRFEFSRTPVRDYFLSNVRMYLGEFRVDGFRFDATGFMRYSSAGNVPGAASLLREINNVIDAEYPGSISIAEDFDADRLATKPIAQGGLGFDSEWDRFSESGARVLTAATDSARDLADLNTALTRTLNGKALNRVIYVESHDTAAPEEVPYVLRPYRGAYLPGRIDTTTAETNLTTRRLSMLGSVLAFTAPGVPMLFMGQEGYATDTFEYPSATPINWTRTLTTRAGIVQLHRDLIALRRDTFGTSAGLRGDTIAVHHRNDGAKVIGYVRTAAGIAPANGGEVLVVVNLSASDFTLGYSVGAPRAGAWRVLFNSDSTAYDAAFTTPPGTYTSVTATAGATDGLPATLTLPRLRPYSAWILSQATATTGWQIR